MLKGVVNDSSKLPRERTCYRCNVGQDALPADVCVDS
jgi:hypothetical protein